jgi:hypothetical protein
LNTNAESAGIRANFWKKAVLRTNISAKNAEVWICRNFFLVFPLDKAAKAAIRAQPEHVPPECVDSNRKAFL